jgi:hypothetical protein
MKRAAGLLIALSIAGCSTQYSSQKLTPDSPKVIYALPQSEAFAMARQAMASAPRNSMGGEYRIDAIHGQLQGYQLIYHGWAYRSHFEQKLYVIPVAGIGAGGQEINGFRFHIIGPWSGVGYDFIRAAGQDSSLTRTLKAALDSTGSTALVTNLQVRPYVEDRDR